MKTIKERFEQTIITGGYLIPTHLRTQLIDELEADVKAWLLETIKETK